MRFIVVSIDKTTGDLDTDISVRGGRNHYSVIYEDLDMEIDYINLSDDYILNEYGDVVEIDCCEFKYIIQELK